MSRLVLIALLPALLLRALSFPSAILAGPGASLPLLSLLPVHLLPSSRRSLPFAASALALLTALLAPLLFVLRGPIVVSGFAAELEVRLLLCVRLEALGLTAPLALSRAGAAPSAHSVVPLLSATALAAGRSTLLVPTAAATGPAGRHLALSVFGSTRSG